MKAQSEFYRSQKNSDWHTYGLMYWSLNDVWQGQSDSSIDYGNRWKLSHYGAKRGFFAPVLLSLLEFPTETLKMTAISDKNEQLEGRAFLFVRNWVDGAVIFNRTMEVNVTPLCSATLLEESFSDLLQGKNPSHFFLTAEMALHSKSGQQFTATNELWLTKLKDAHLINPSVTIEETGRLEGGTVAKLKIRCEAATPYVFIEMSVDGHLSDNGMMCLGIPISVNLTSRNGSILPKTLDLDTRDIFSVSNASYS